MNVYPVNLMEGAAIASQQRESHSLLTDIHNRYLDFTVDFTAREITVQADWRSIVEADSFIIGNTNAVRGTLRLALNGTAVYTRTFDTPMEINIVEFDSKRSFNAATFTFSGNENIFIGLLYIGEKWTLPRFITFPKHPLSLRSEHGRTFSAQVTGIPSTNVRGFSASFVRIPDIEVKKIDRYINGVQTVIPHVIDAYPLAHREVPPMFATIAAYGEKEKRAENGFFWNFEITWMEAR